ncbi:MAG: BMP family ABC transporter substrate-binding protein [Candidatus Eisenbacteria sp.]|nr:BMP family ABC transporter substrate-binding protein [Candidatus Eisenbacteria bacterium]
MPMTGAVREIRAHPRASVAMHGLVVLLAATACLGFALLAGCGGGDDGHQRGVLHVGLVFDVGGLGDKSFNDLAYAGLMRAHDEVGISFEYFEPTQSSEREGALRLFAQGDAELIIGVGFLFTDDIRAVAEDFPDKYFICIDYTWTEGDSVPANLVGLKFREEEGSFMVGAMAAMVSETGVIGFVGGMDIPLIHKFEAGYRAGALHVNPGMRVMVNYAGVTDMAFKNPSKGKELGLAQYEQGADIIFHASGSTGLGVFEAAREKDKLAIGVDADQSAEAPGLILTSMIKNVDLAVFEQIRRTIEGSFEGGVLVLGLREGAVGYIRNESNEQWLTPEIVARLDGIRDAIVAGSITVPIK